VVAQNAVVPQDAVVVVRTCAAEAEQIGVEEDQKTEEVAAGTAAADP